MRRPTNPITAAAVSSTSQIIDHERLNNSDHIQNNDESDIRMKIDMRNIYRNDCEYAVQVQHRDNFQNDEHDIMHAYDNYL